MLWTVIERKLRRSGEKDPASPARIHRQTKLANLLAQGQSAPGFLPCQLLSERNEFVGGRLANLTDPLHLETPKILTIPILMMTAALRPEPSDPLEVDAEWEVHLPPRWQCLLTSQLGKSALSAYRLKRQNCAGKPWQLERCLRQWQRVMLQILVMRMTWQ